MLSEKKSMHEEFAEFFEKPTKDKLRNLLKRNYGEMKYLDFKQEWLPFPKVARHVLAMANSEGGCVVFGVAEESNSLNPTGLSEVKNKLDAERKIKKFLPSQLKFEVIDFSFNDSEYKVLIGKTFQVVIVLDTPEYLPFISKTESQGMIETNIIYVRRKSESTRTSYEELQEILNRRIQTGLGLTHIRP